MRAVLLSLLCAFIAGCTCGALDPNARFACTTDADCGVGFACRTVNGALECVATGAGGGGPNGGGAATGGSGGGATGGAGGGVTGGGSGGGGVTGGGVTGGGVTGGGGPLGGGATGGGGVGPATKLAFATPPQTVAVGQCSQPLIIETRDALDRTSPVSSDTDLSMTAMSAMPAMTSFFTDSACTTSANNPRLTMGSSRLTLYFRISPSVGTVTLTAAAVGLASANQAETVAPAPDGLTLSFSAAVQPAGACVLATVTAISGGQPTNVSIDESVSLSSSIPGGMRFFADSSCVNSPLTSAVIARNAQSQDFYIRPISGGNHAVGASARFGTAALTMRVNPAVRRSSCPIGLMASSVSCSVAPAQLDPAHTLLVFQASVGNANEPMQAEVRCRLSNVDTIVCTRNQAGESGTIHWQTLELATNLTVQRHSSSNCPSVLPLGPAVDPARSFSLATVVGAGGGNYDGDDMTTTRMVDGGVMVFESGGSNCQGFDLQVAEWGSGVSVVRGSSPAFAAGEVTVNVMGLPFSGPNTVLLAGMNMLGGNAPGSASMCHFFPRGELDTPTSLFFSRGAINPSCGNYSMGQLVWQRVDFGARARVLSSVVTLPGNTPSTTETLSAAVDMTRTLVFAGGSMASGQATGETAYNNTADDEIGDVVATFELISSTQVRVTRADEFSTARFTMYAVEFDP